MATNPIKHAELIVTHPRTAHRDDFLSCCIILAVRPEVAIERRAATAAELEDRTVAVVDTGRRFNPARNNLDHHQLTEASEDCALSLLLKSMGRYNLALTTWPWLGPTQALDNGGPKALARLYGIPETTSVAGLLSPIEKAMLEQFSMVVRLTPDAPLHSVMRALGRQLLDQLDSAYLLRRTLAARSEVRTVGGHLVFTSDVQDLGHHPALLESHIAENHSAAEVIMVDDSYENWVLYRRSERYDFRKIKNRTCVQSADARGVWCKVSRPLTPEHLLALLDAAGGKKAAG